MELSFLCYTAVDQLFLHSQAIWYRQESRWSRSGVHVGWEDWLPEWQCRPNICLGMYLSPCSVIYSYLLCSFWKFENGDNNSSLTELFRRWDEAKWERSQALCRSSRCDLGLFFPTYVLAAACTWGLSLSLSFFDYCLMLSVLMFLLLSVILRASGIGEHSTAFILGYK